MLKKISAALGKASSAKSALGLLLLSSCALALAGCSNESTSFDNSRATRPIPADTLALMQEKGTTKSAPILIRAYKKEADFEIWKMKPDGRYVLLKTFPMCRWSGQLGPKKSEGDRQVPEGFYNITPGQMNPQSHYYLSFNVGYPNSYDRAYGRHGGNIMVHGACSSAGCFSMTDDQIAEIYAIAREAFAGGQRSIQMQSLPFHMNAENMAKYRLDPNAPFWRQLKDGTDHFEVTKAEPKVAVCGRRYVFDAQSANGQPLEADGVCPPLRTDPSIERAVAEKEHQDQIKVAELINKGERPIRTLYADGGQNSAFRGQIGDVSQPYALEQGPTDMFLDDLPARKLPSVQLAGAKATATKESVVAAAVPTVTSRAQSQVNGLKEVHQPVLSAAAQTPLSPLVQQQEDAPFYNNWFGLTGSNQTPTVSQAAPQMESATNATPSNVPVPPHRAKTAAPAKRPTAQPTVPDGTLSLRQE